MEINGYEIAYSEAELDKMLNEQMLPVVLIDEQFEGYQKLQEGDKKALKHLVAAAKIMNEVSQEQDHHMNIVQRKALEKATISSSYAAKALKLFMSLNGVEGLNGLDAEPVEIFKGISGLPGRNFYPVDLTVGEFHKIIQKMLEDGKVDEVRKILSARTMVRRDGEVLKAIDYTEYFAKEFSAIANELEVAAHYTTDEKFKDYLGWQAQALIQNNEDMDMLADKHWAVLQDSELEFTLSRECYDDAITPSVFENSALMALLNRYNIEVNSKDMLGIRVGIVNKQGTELLLKFKDLMKELAAKMPFAERYEQNINKSDELKQTMVDADLAALTGDYAQCRGGITTAQNLPNNDKLSIKTGGGRRNVYHRQVRMSVDKEKNRKLLERLVAPELHRYFDPETDHLFVIGHENGHSLGPDSKYQTGLGQYKHIIEEHKADIVSMAFMPEYVKAGVIDDETLKKIYVTHVVYRLFGKAKPQLSLPHRVAELIELNYLLENKAISFDEDMKLHIDFERFPQVMRQLLEDTVEIQLSMSPQKAKEFIERYSVWSDVSQKIAAVHAELGVKPYKDIKMFF
ncbi:MAG: hypothetical protein J6L86_03270 [Alphaproteobacteria bacterium]|nr:hypothetical protein [Alphaproteobacteria bacterium]